MRVADLFCGVGGFHLGCIENTGVVFANDMDEKANVTYQLNFSTPLTKGKIESITEFPDFEILTAGFPCQPFSIAGKQHGFEDERGQLFFELARIIALKKPEILLLENVKNLASHNKGETLRTMLSKLDELGYTCKTKVMNSCEYGNVPQNRERIYIVGFRDSKKAKRFAFPEKIPLTKSVASILDEEVDAKYYYTPSSKIYKLLCENVLEENVVYQYRRTYVRANKSGVCPTLTSNMGTGGHNVPIVKTNVGIRKLTPRECFRLQGFPESFRLPKISDSHLYKQVGNTVTVPVIHRLFEAITSVNEQV